MRRSPTSRSAVRSCSASSSGDIDDLVNIANNGVLEYRASTRIRADAMGDVTTTASVELPDRFSDDDEQQRADQSVLR
ncbi:MAG: hypothetical protein H7A20_01760 [Rhodanobacteraceae bacterium]|nr:hypothetical protein [Rhodanobacteraceae bacterium]